MRDAMVMTNGRLYADFGVLNWSEAIVGFFVVFLFFVYFAETDDSTKPGRGYHYKTKGFNRSRRVIWRFCIYLGVCVV